MDSRKMNVKEHEKRKRFNWTSHITNNERDQNRIIMLEI